MNFSNGTNAVIPDEHVKGTLRVSTSLIFFWFFLIHHHIFIILQYIFNITITLITTVYIINHFLLIFKFHIYHQCYQFYVSNVYVDVNPQIFHKFSNVSITVMFSHECFNYIHVNSRMFQLSIHEYFKYINGNSPFNYLH